MSFRRLQEALDKEETQAFLERSLTTADVLEYAPFQIQLIIHFKLPLLFKIIAHDKTLPGGCGENIKA